MIGTLRIGKMFGLASLWESRGSDKIATNGDTKYAMAQSVPISRAMASFPKSNFKRKRDDDVDEIILDAGGKHEKPSSAKRRKGESAASQPKVTQGKKLPKNITPVVEKPRPEPVQEEEEEEEEEEEKEKKRKKDVAAAAAAAAASISKLESSWNTDALRGIIESQLSLEILMKHDELRLVNQELAKCQIALEQLRRCHLIPYPISKASPFDPVDTSNGAGPAIEPEPSMPKAEWAPPYGVTDGPYTRHYAKWLIPDAVFDGVHPDWAFADGGARVGKAVAEGRTTRNSFVDAATPVGARSRTHRGSSTHKLQALSSGYPQPKGKAGPCTLKRSDGQLVKLVCRDCNREDFSSTQGFINHCRIAHKRDYKSHEEAAIACGEPIELDEVGGIIGEDKSPTAATGLVHPLIRAAASDKETYLNLMSHIGASIRKFHLGELPGVTAIPTSNPSTPIGKAGANQNKNFVSSSETPFLSDLMKSRGFGGNLAEMVTESKVKIDEGESSSSDEDDSDVEKDASAVTHRGLLYDGPSEFQASPYMRVPARSTISPAPFGRPVSSKGLDRKSGISPRLSYAAPINTAAANHHRHALRIVDSPKTHDGEDGETDAHALIADPASICDLSPNTVASNNDLPALVSDDGEYDDEDNDDDGKSLASEGDADEDSDVAEISIEDGEGGAETTVVARAAGRRLKIKKEDRHVTFVSTVKGGGKVKGGGGGGRKKDGRGRK